MLEALNSATTFQKHRLKLAMEMQQCTTRFPSLIKVAFVAQMMLYERLARADLQGLNQDLVYGEVLGMMIEPL